MIFYDAYGSEIKIGSKCVFHTSSGETRTGTVTAVSIVQHPLKAGGVEIQWEALVQDSEISDFGKSWVSTSLIQVTHN